MRNHSSFIVPVILMGLLTGCDSNDDNDDPPRNTPPSEPQRGSLIDDPPPLVSSYSAADVAETFGQGIEGEALLQFAGDPVCGVDVHQLRYRTVDEDDEPTTASGVLMIPTGSGEECSGERPMLLYAHGTAIEQTLNLADVEAENSFEARYLAVAFAARGYIVVAPNYVGYDTSDSDDHSYLVADQSAKDMIDALTAARTALPTSSASETVGSEQLFITGYSQGGHVAMATHRAMQEEGQSVTASAPMSGPYALSAFGDAVFFGQVNARAPIVMTFLLTAYEDAYDDIYDEEEEVFEAAYAEDIDDLLPGPRSRSELFDQGLLPRDQLFSDTPPDPIYAPYTPATEPAEFADIFALGFGPDHLLRNDFRLAYLQDAEANPDGGFPDTTTAEPPENPAFPFRVALKRNDLRNWTPEAPVFLCAGNGDPTVFFFNTQLMQSYWAQTDADVTVLDIEADPEGDDPYENLKEGFDAAKTLVEADAVASGEDPDAAVLDAYHELVAPFCLSAVRDWFDAQLSGE